MFDKYFRKGHLTINEFAQIVGMTATALRHYDRQDIFKPDRHGIEFENLYRYYTPQQITMVRMCRVLAYIGVPLQTIRSLTQHRSPEKLLKLLRKQKGRVEASVFRLREILSTINVLMELISTGLSVAENDIYIAKMPEQNIVLGDVNDFSDSAGLHREFARFCGSLRRHGLNPSYPIGGYFVDMDVFLELPSCPTRFFSLNPDGPERIAEGLYLVAYTRGYYGETNDTPQRMVAFAKNHGLVFNGPVYQIYLHDEICIADPNQYLLQISASVRDTRRSYSTRFPYPF